LDIFVPVPLEAPFVEPVEEVDFGAGRPDVRVHPDELEEGPGAALLDPDDERLGQFARRPQPLLLQKAVLPQGGRRGRRGREVVRVDDAHVVHRRPQSEVLLLGHAGRLQVRHRAHIQTETKTQTLIKILFHSSK